MDPCSSKASQINAPQQQEVCCNNVFSKCNSVLSNHCQNNLAAFNDELGSLVANPEAALRDGNLDNCSKTKLPIGTKAVSVLEFNNAVNVSKAMSMVNAPMNSKVSSLGELQMVKENAVYGADQINLSKKSVFVQPAEGTKVLGNVQSKAGSVFTFSAHKGE